MAIVDPRPRPRFQRSLTAPLAALKSALEARIVDPDVPCKGRVFEQHAELRVPVEDHHFGSPELYIAFRSAEDRTELHCRFGPRSDIWTAFIFGFVLFSLCIVAGLVLGFSQSTSGATPWGYWIVPVGVIGGALVHTATFVGQILGRAQMVQLQTVLDDALASLKPDRHSWELPALTD